MAEKQLLTISATSRELAMSRNKVRSMIREGTLPSVVLPGGSVVVPRAALRQWLDDLTRRALDHTRPPLEAA
jgi:excisionase family DNA binding protein